MVMVVVVEEVEGRVVLDGVGEGGRCGGWAQ